MYVMPIFLLIKKTKMYIPNDNCNTCLITMTTIGRMSGLIFKKSFYPALRTVKLPPQNSVGAKKLGGRSTVRKRPIGEG